MFLWPINPETSYLILQGLDFTLLMTISSIEIWTHALSTKSSLDVSPLLSTEVFIEED